MTTRPNQLQATISSAFDAVLARRPETRHRADFDAVWTRLGYPNDPALKAHTFASLAADFARWDARDALRQTLAAADARQAHARRLEAASALGRRQGWALALREHQKATLAALDRRITADRERRAKLRPTGPIRVW